MAWKEKPEVHKHSSKQKKIDMVLIIETKLNNKETANIKGYKWMGKK